MGLLHFCIPEPNLDIWQLDTHTMIVSFDTNDFMTYVYVYVNLLIKDGIIIISVSINRMWYMLIMFLRQ